MPASPSIDLAPADEDLLRDTDLTDILDWRRRVSVPGALRLYECSKDTLLYYFDRLVAICQDQRRLLRKSEDLRRIRRLARQRAELIALCSKWEISVPERMRDDV
jgi:hypothetical protein